jgi:hypothetical protein
LTRIWTLCYTEGMLTTAALLALTGLVLWGIVRAWHEASKYQDPFTKEES